LIEAAATGTTTRKLPIYERWRWQIFAVTWLAYAGFYLTRKSFAVAKIPLSDPSGLALSNEMLAKIDFAYLAAYAVGQFFWGLCGDRYGTRRVILIGMFGAVLAAVGMGASSLLVLLVVFSAIHGIFQSSGWAPLSKNLGCFFSQRERGSIMGLWCTNYALGGFLATVLAARAAELWGWRWAFYLPAIVLLVVWVTFIFFQRDRPEDVGLPPIESYHGENEPVLKSNETPADEPEGSWKVVWEVLTNPMVLLLAAVYFFMKPARYAILLWGPKYVNEKLGTSVTKSGAIGALFELAGPVSVLVAGVLSDKLFRSRRMPISVLCLASMAVVLFVIDKFPVSKLWFGGCLFLMGLLIYAPDSLVSGTAAVDFGTKKGASTASGVINGCGSIGAIVGGTLPGFFEKRWGWDGVFTLLAGSVLIAALLLLPKWNSLPRRAQA
jgi:OPA family sugar phosphate sensor protein UhpC-like MFS transporter